MAPRKADKKTPRTSQVKSSWFDNFRFGESYTSLILGIIVVIITTILIVLIVRGRNFNQVTGPKQVSSTSTSRIAQNSATPSVTIVTRNFSITQVPKPTATPVKSQSSIKGGKSYTVVAGDNLWKIAEKFYKSGYNWVDIARVNKLPNPSLITIGTKLTIPDVQPKVVTVQATVSPDTIFGPKITGSIYAVKKGDHLWGIAVRAYGDGYKWVEIARVNNILTPGTIYAGTILKLPKKGN